MTATPPVLSIVTITWQNATGLAATLASIAEQRALGERVEVVVVDGGSTDGTDEVVRLSSLPRLDVVSEPDRGVYDAMNKGVRRSTGRWLQFLNAGDSFSDPDALAALLDALDREDGPEGREWLVAGAVHLLGGEGEPTRIANLPYDRRRHDLGMQPHCHQSTLVLRETFDRLGGYSEDYDFVGDFDLILRLGRLGRPAELDRVVVAYEGGGMSAQRAREIPWLLHRVRVDRNGWGRGRSALDAIFTRGRAAYVRLRVAVSNTIRR